MQTYIVAVWETGTNKELAEIYEIEAPSAEEACYVGKDWYENDFHAHTVSLEAVAHQAP